jgi:ATP-dependent exoDNAse (exonuclease V) beta subunit
VTDPVNTSSPTRKWTPEQWRGITTVGHSLLVSAAAGSGKTAMLSERCAYLVCDADEPCDVDELLVVTFTDAAAGEMKSRITAALRSRAERDPHGRAAQQLRLVDAAQVSTLHSFCSRVLRQHFHLIGLDPGFSVLDGEEAKLLRTEVARELFADRYELDDTGEFQRFVDAYGDGDDERLVRLVIKTHELLCSVVDAAGWIEQARGRLREAATRPLNESALGRELHERIARAIDDLAARCDRATDVVRRLDGFDKYLGALRELEQTIRHWDRVFRTSGLSALKDVSDVPTVKLPPIKNTVPGKELAKAAVDSVRDEMKGGTWRDLLRFSPDEWLDGLRSTVPHANVYLGLVEQFARRYRAAKDTARALDFADLERFTLDVLRDPEFPEALAPSAAARSYHRRFRHVLVDEYQDINEVQDAILSLASTECLVGEGTEARRHGGTKGGARSEERGVRSQEGEASETGNPLAPSPGTPGEGGGEGLWYPAVERETTDTGGTLTQPSPGVPGEGNALGPARASRGGRGRRPAGSSFGLHPSSSLPNLFCVGDVKQSIYRFRLAEAGRFLARQAQFRADGGRRLGDVIDLQKNFRSRARLLDAINAVFAKLMTAEAVDITYDESHVLRAGAEYPPGDGVCTFAGAPIEMHLLPAKLESAGAPSAEGEDGAGAACEEEAAEAEMDRAEREAVLLARRIREMMGMDGQAPMCVTERGAGPNVARRGAWESVQERGGAAPADGGAPLSPALSPEYGGEGAGSATGTTNEVSAHNLPLPGTPGSGQGERSSASAGDEPPLTPTLSPAYRGEGGRRDAESASSVDGPAPAGAWPFAEVRATSPPTHHTRPLRFSDCVILLRSMKFKADRYAGVLRRHGIPVHSESGSGYFDSTEIGDVLALLSLLNNGRQDVPLAAVLRSPLGNLPEPENSLARVRLAYPRGAGLAFHEAVSAYANERDDELAERLKAFFANLARWRELAQRRPLADLVSGIYEQTGYLAYVSGLAGGEQRAANLLDLLERARQFGTFHRQGLARFLAFIDALREEADLGQPSVATEAEDVVRIMSVHRSKGLEFPVVFLPDLGKQINLDDCQGSILVDRQAGLGMAVVDEARKVRYPSLASMLVRSRLRQQALAEEMRVLYVAMTRAKEHLVLVGTCADELPEQWRSRWAGHVGPLPTDAVLGVTRVLDWLGPVAAAAGAANDVVEVRGHSTADVSRWTSSTEHRPNSDMPDRGLAELAPLDPPPPPDGAAEEVVARLTSAYPYDTFAHLPAAEAMSEEPDRLGTAGPVATLHKPRFMLEAGDPAAADVGEATHIVLQHLDFRRSCDREDLASQLAEFVERKLIAPAQAKSVDLPALTWLAQSTAGELLREHADVLRRELPVHVAVGAGEHANRGEGDRAQVSADPQDRVMRRGRLDVLIPLAGGSILIDYKTDRVAPGDVPRRAELYRGQVDAYRQAVQAITGEPVREVLLAFLAARVVHRM